jgi:hypothetical protein
VGGIKMDLKYYPIHITHIFVSLIAFTTLGVIDWIEFTLIPNITSSEVFFIVIQNAILGSANSYWLIKTHITPSQAEIETSQAQKQ